MVLCDDLEGWDGGVGGRSNRERIYIYMCTHTHTHIYTYTHTYIYIYTAASFHCAAETNTML